MRVALASIRRTIGWLVLVQGVAVPPAQAQGDFQLWGNVTLDWAKHERLVYRLGLEPKILVAKPEDEPGWYRVDLKPNVEYSPKGWLDLVGEATLSSTKQTIDVNTIELSPRVDVRVHPFSRSEPTRGVHARELPPRRRIVVRDLVRIESRNFFYVGEGSGTSSDVRFRNRLEFLVSLNKEKMTDDGARHLLADWEWVVPMGQPDERFANKRRIRTGLGYRRDFTWRFEVLYIWNRSRNTTEDGFTTSDNIINICVRRVF